MWDWCVFTKLLLLAGLCHIKTKHYNLFWFKIIITIVNIKEKENKIDLTRGGFIFTGHSHSLNSTPSTPPSHLLDPFSSLCFPHTRNLNPGNPNPNQATSREQSWQRPCGGRRHGGRESKPSNPETLQHQAQRQGRRGRCPMIAMASPVAIPARRRSRLKQEKTEERKRGGENEWAVMVARAWVLDGDSSHGHGGWPAGTLPKNESSRGRHKRRELVRSMETRWVVSNPNLFTNFQSFNARSCAWIYACRISVFGYRYCCNLDMNWEWIDLNWDIEFSNLVIWGDL